MQIHIAAVAAGLSATTFAIVGANPNIPIIILSTTGAASVYLIDRLDLRQADPINNPERTRWFAENRMLVVVVLAVLAVVALLTIRVVGSTTGVFTVLVAAACLPFIGLGSPAKVWWHLKPASISLMWSAGVVVLPLLSTGVSVTGLMLLFAYRFFYLLPNTLLADLPDIHGDKAAGKMTPAATLPMKSVYVLVGASAMAAMGFALALVATGIDPLVIGLDVSGIVLYFLVVAVIPSSQQRFKFALDLVLLWPFASAMLVLAF